MSVKGLQLRSRLLVVWIIVSEGDACHLQKGKMATRTSIFCKPSKSVKRKNCSSPTLLLVLSSPCEPRRRQSSLKSQGQTTPCLWSISPFIFYIEREFIWHIFHAKQEMCMTHIVGHMSQKLKADIIPLSFWIFHVCLNIFSETLACVMNCEHQISVIL